MQLVQIVEATCVNCATFSDAQTLATGGRDNLVLLWRVIQGSSSTSNPAGPDGPRLKLSHLMRGHRDKVNCIAASKAWSLLVSGSEDSSVIVWDLNRASYVRTIWHERSVTGSAIHNTSVCGHEIRLIGRISLDACPL